MKKAIALLSVFVLLCGLVIPTEAWAWARGGWHGGWHHHGCCWGWGAFWPAAVVGGLFAGAAIAATAPFAYAAPPVVYQPAPVYTQAAPVYSAPPYAAPVSYSSAPPVSYSSASSVQREVVHPNGKYVLYGDGVSQPWQWVWVPNPSVPPPPPPTPR